MINHWMYRTNCTLRVSHIDKQKNNETYPDLASTVATELNGDGGRSKVGRHGEVRDCAGQEHDDGDLMEEACATTSLDERTEHMRRAKRARDGLTASVQPMTASSDKPNSANTAHNQSDP